MQTQSKCPRITEANIIHALEALPDAPRRTFTEFEVKAIRKYVPLKGVKEVARILGKSVVSVTNKWYKVKNGFERRG